MAPTGKPPGKVTRVKHDAQRRSERQPRTDVHGRLGFENNRKKTDEGDDVHGPGHRAHRPGHEIDDRAVAGRFTDG